jgi:hypothetical protein
MEVKVNNQTIIDLHCATDDLVDTVALWNTC